jgi:hypothetical protein
LRPLKKLLASTSASAAGRSSNCLKPSDKEDFQVATDLYYVDVNKQKGGLFRKTGRP